MLDGQTLLPLIPGLWTGWRETLDDEGKPIQDSEWALFSGLSGRIEFFLFDLSSAFLPKDVGFIPHPFKPA